MPLQEKFMRLLKASGMSYTDLAELSGVSTATISRVVNGANVNVDNLETLIDTLEKHMPPNARQEDVSMQCKHCRAEAIRHNDALREAFERHTSMMQTNFDQRMSEIKSSYEREITQKEKEITGYKRRTMALAIALCVLGSAVLGMFIVDWTNGSVGWHRFAYGDYADTARGVLHLLADWLHL